MVKLSDVNKTIHSIQSGKNSLSYVIKNISSINKKVSFRRFKLLEIFDTRKMAVSVLSN